MNLEGFVQGVRLKPGSNQLVDPLRAQKAEKLKVNTKRNTQRNQKGIRSIKVGVAHSDLASKIDPFAESDHEGSTITSIDQVQDGGSHINTHGELYGHPTDEQDPSIHDQEEQQEGQQEGPFEYDPEDIEYDSVYEEVEVDEHDQPIDQRAVNKIGDEHHRVFTQHRTESLFPSTTSGNLEPDEEQQTIEPQAQDEHNFSRPSFLTAQPQPLFPTPSSNKARKLQQQDSTQAAPPAGRRNLDYESHGQYTSLAHRQTAVPAVRRAHHLEPRNANIALTKTHNDRPTHQGVLAQHKDKPHIVDHERPHRGATSANQDLVDEGIGQALDYDIEKLKNMDYDKLRTQDFDEDPSKTVSDALKTNDDDPSKSLHERLTAAQNVDGNKKSELLASLSLDEWEDAGDWFLGRFGDILQKMKESRRERRKLAQEFEGKVSERHEHVQGKKRVIEEALAEMGKSGQSILRSGTPKKRVKARE